MFFVSIVHFLCADVMRLMKTADKEGLSALNGELYSLDTLLASIYSAHTVADSVFEELSPSLACVLTDRPKFESALPRNPLEGNALARSDLIDQAMKLAHAECEDGAPLTASKQLALFANSVRLDITDCLLNKTVLCVKMTKEKTLITDIFDFFTKNELHHATQSRRFCEHMTRGWDTKSFAERAIAMQCWQLLQFFWKHCTLHGLSGRSRLY